MRSGRAKWILGSEVGNGRGQGVSSPASQQDPQFQVLPKFQENPWPMLSMPAYVRTAGLHRHMAVPGLTFSYVGIREKG